ncbi:MAG: DUF2796 domain-containing protein [Pseudomonadota bacterium]
MTRYSVLLGVSVFALAACQPAENAADALEADAPPAVAEEVIVEEVVETPEPTVETVAAESEAEATEGDEGDRAEDHEHDHDEDHDHDHGEDEAHADHDAHDHEEHDHEAHDHDEHDHGDHDHGAGEAHVHGLSELAASLDGSTLSISLEGALANFGLDETIRELDDTAPYTDGIVAVQGGECVRDTASASIRPIGDHGNMMIDLTYTCSAIDSLTGIDVTGFANFSGFEQVDAVFLSDAGQTAESLTASDTVLDLP